MSLFNRVSQHLSLMGLSTLPSVETRQEKRRQFLFMFGFTVFLRQTQTRHLKGVVICNALWRWNWMTMRIPNTNAKHKEHIPQLSQVNHKQWASREQHKHFHNCRWKDGYMGKTDNDTQTRETNCTHKEMKLSVNSEGRWYSRSTLECGWKRSYRKMI